MGAAEPRPGLITTAVPLGQLPKRLRRPLAVAIGMGILNELARLHQEARVRGRLEVSDVLIGCDGSVRIAPGAAAVLDTARERSSARLAEVQAAGVILCRLLGAPLAEPIGRREAPPLRTARSIANLPRQKRPGYEALRASLMLWEAAGRLCSTRAQARAAEQLGRLAEDAMARKPRLKVLPPPRPSPPSRPAPAPARALPLLAGAAVLIATALGAVMWSPQAPSPHKTVAEFVPPVAPDQLQADLAPTVHTTPTPVVAPETPAPGPPPAAGDVRSVSLLPIGPCSAGEPCHLQVRVGLNPAPSYRSVTYVIQSACTVGGPKLVLGAGEVMAAPSWNLIIGDVFVTVPAAGTAPVRAVTSAPAEAASAPLRLAADGC